VVIEPERPTGSVAARTSALRTLLADRRFARVQWDAATLTAAHVQADPARALLTLRFPRPMDVPTILGVPVDAQGDATGPTETSPEGTRPLTPQDAARFAAALEVQVSIDLRGRRPIVTSVDARTIPTMCLLSEVPPSLR
jgi:hypothetical protein